MSTEHKKVACQSCDWTGTDEDRADEEPAGFRPVYRIHKLHERVAPGEIMPAGECPECGALCRYVATDADTDHTPGPWEYVPSGEHHGAYITSEFGNTIADFYTMTLPHMPSTASGGPSRPAPFMGKSADANARLAHAAPDLLAALKALLQNHRLVMLTHGSYTPQQADAMIVAVEGRAAIAKALGK